MNAKPAAPQGKVENVANPQTVDIPSAVTNSLAPLMQEDPAQVLAWFKTVRPMQVNDQALARLTAAKSGLESVTEIDARGGAVTDVGLASLEKLPALQSLALDGTQVTDEGMKALQKVPSLQSLSINGTRISDAGLGSLASLPGLKRLEMMNCDLTPADFAAIGKLPALESLVLNRVLELNDAGLDMICEASTLKSLQINECIAITDKGLVALAKAPGLEELSMNRANITGVGFTAAHGKGGLKSLKSLSVSGVQINLPGAKSINTLKTLESLNIGYVPGLNDQFCVEFVEGLRNLRELNIEASKGVLGQCFSKMKACSNSLETINAQNSGIADQGLGFLRNHKKLKFIDASNTNLTLMGVQQFKKLVPECEILYAGERY
jgi:Leucine-rich repeat (LRR) protein